MNSIGGRIASSRPPRRHALTTPTSVPITNAMTVVTPTSPSVHGSFDSDLGHHRNALRGDAELAGEAVPEVLEVSDEDVLVDVDAELDLERVQRRRVDAAERRRAPPAPRCPASRAG